MDALWPVEVVRQAVDSLDSLLPWNSGSISKAHAHFQLDFPRAFVSRLEVAHIPKGTGALEQRVVTGLDVAQYRCGHGPSHHMAGGVWHPATR